MDEENRAELRNFLATVADSALKVKILRLFLSDPGLCLSSPALSERLGSSMLETRCAVQQLDESGALNYCPHFAFADLCHLSLSRLPQPMQLQLGVLLKALRFQPELVWCSFEKENEASEPEETANRTNSIGSVHPLAQGGKASLARSDRP